MTIIKNGEDVTDAMMARWGDREGQFYCSECGQWYEGARMVDCHNCREHYCMVKINRTEE